MALDQVISLPMRLCLGAAVPGDGCWEGLSRDGGATPTDDLDEAFVLQQRHSAVRGSDRHRMGHGEFRDSRQLVAGLEPTGPDVIPQGCGDLLVWPA